MQYLRRSIAFFFALQQLKLDLASMSADQYLEIFERLTSQDPGLQNLFTRVVKAKPLLVPFLHHRNTFAKLVSGVDNVLIKHPIYSYPYAESVLTSLPRIMKLTDRYAREEWVQEEREDEVHFMFSLLALVKHNMESITNKKLFEHFDLDFIEDEAFIVLREYGDDFSQDAIYTFYQLAFTALPKKGSKEKRTKP